MSAGQTVALLLLLGLTAGAGSIATHLFKRLRCASRQMPMIEVRSHQLQTALMLWVQHDQICQVPEDRECLKCDQLRQDLREARAAFHRECDRLREILLDRLPPEGDELPQPEPGRGA